MRRFVLENENSQTWDDLQPVLSSPVLLCTRVVVIFSTLIRSALFFFVFFVFSRSNDGGTCKNVRKDLLLSLLFMSFFFFFFKFQWIFIRQPAEKNTERTCTIFVSFSNDYTHASMKYKFPSALTTTKWYYYGRELQYCNKWFCSMMMTTTLTCIQNRKGRSLLVSINLIVIEHVHPSCGQIYSKNATTELYLVRLHLPGQV